MIALLIALVLIAAVGIGAALRPPPPLREAAREAGGALARVAPAIIHRARARRPGVVLVHGILGFDQVGLGPTRVDYFRGIAARLEAAGLDVITARTAPLGGVPVRAAQLARTIDELPHDRLVLIGHSMGGLDGRWALAREGISDRVAALLTIGTPHRGSPIADLLAVRPLDRARRAMHRFGLSSEALDWLTTRRLEMFNAEVGDVASVRYASVIVATANRARVHPLLRAPHAYLARKHGPSDGLVPRSSQLWGEILGEEEADHWAQMGWSTAYDAAAMLLRALDALGAMPRARSQQLALPAAAAG